MQQILRLPQVIALTGLCRSTIMNYAKLGKFPRPFKISERCNGWHIQDIETWLEDRRTAPRQGG